MPGFRRRTGRRHRARKAGHPANAVAQYRRRRWVLNWGAMGGSHCQSFPRRNKIETPAPSQFDWDGQNKIGCRHARRLGTNRTAVHAYKAFRTWAKLSVRWQFRPALEAKMARGKPREWWQTQIAALESSGQTQRAFAESNSISQTSLQKWLYVERKSRSQAGRRRWCRSSGHGRPMSWPVSAASSSASPAAPTPHGSPTCSVAWSATLHAESAAVVPRVAGARALRYAQGFPVLARRGPVALAGTRSAGRRFVYFSRTAAHDGQGFVVVGGRPVVVQQSGGLYRRCADADSGSSRGAGGRAAADEVDTAATVRCTRTHGGRYQKPFNFMIRRTNSPSV